MPRFQQLFAARVAAAMLGNDRSAGDHDHASNIAF